MRNWLWKLREWNASWICWAKHGSIWKLVGISDKLPRKSLGESALEILQMLGSTSPNVLKIKSFDPPPSLPNFTDDTDDSPLSSPLSPPPALYLVSSKEWIFTGETNLPKCKSCVTSLLWIILHIFLWKKKDTALPQRPTESLLAATKLNTDYRILPFICLSSSRTPVTDRQNCRIDWICDGYKIMHVVTLINIENTLCHSSYNH